MHPDQKLDFPDLDRISLILIKIVDENANFYVIFFSVIEMIYLS